MAAQGQSVLDHRPPSKPNGARRNPGAVCIAATASAAIASITVRENQSSKFVDRTHKQGWHDKMANSVVIRPAGTERVRFSTKKDWRVGAGSTGEPKDPSF
jgi:hypothetical protein